MSLARIQKAAPEFTTDAVMPGGQFGSVSLSDYRGKYVVLFFYPLDFTFVCPTEICAFSDAADRFAAEDVQVLACSVDSKFSHLAWTQKPRAKGGLGPMQIPLLADITKQIAKDYGVLIEEGADAGIALRGLFIIAPDGTLRQSTINDLPVGRNVDEVLRLVQAFKFTDEHGEVCPAGWRKGARSMKADPEGSQEYFQAASEEAKA
uniref:thioredoxin-dependent peroxiredoxin n=1 Tax=Heterosigma akashiwo TaxID=2829 RepID=A0A6V2QIJ5_HETAK